MKNLFETHPTFDISVSVRAARRAQKDWALLPAGERARFFRKLRGILTRDSDAIARLIAEENKKTPLEALSQEIIPLSDACLFLERNAERLLRPEPLKLTTRQFYFRGRRCEIRHEPCGVIGIIGTWNYAFFISFSQALFALAASNGVVLKGAPESPRVTALLVTLAAEAGLPQGLFAAFTGGREEGEALCKAGCDKYILTGSRQTGRAVLRTLADELKPAVMELSGADPYVILSDADWPLAVRTLLWASFQYSGQTCVAPRQLLILEKDREVFVTELNKAWEASRGFLERQGDLRSADRAEAEIARIRELESRGAKRLRRAANASADSAANTGSKKNGFFPASVFEIPADFDMAGSEFMAPVFFVRFLSDTDTIESVLRSLDFALGLSVWTRDRREAERLVNAARTGQAWVNDSLVSTALPEAPFGGRGDSGFGRTRGAAGLLEMTEPKIVTADYRSRRSTRHLWPYPPNAYEALSEIHRIAFGTSWKQKYDALSRLVRTAFRA